MFLPLVLDRVLARVQILAEALGYELAARPTRL